jgi:hypothetical protein
MPPTSTYTLKNVNGPELTSSPDQQSNDLIKSGSSDKGEWCSAKKLIGVKRINGKRYYKVVWENPKDPPSWVAEEDVSDLLKQTYQIRHTKRRALRRSQTKRRLTF